MAQVSLWGYRSSAGTTATDGWLNYKLDSSYTLGSSYKLTSIYCRFTKVRSASGEFTGDVPVVIVTANGEYDIGDIEGYTFPASTDTSGTTISGYLTPSASELAAINVEAIERIDLGQSSYNGGKDIRCTSESTCELILVYEDLTLSSPGAPSFTQNNNGTYTATWTAATLSSSGTVYYALWDVSNGGLIQDGITGTSVTRSIGGYNFAGQYRIIAYYGNSSYWYASLEAASSVSTKTFYPPSISTPALTLGSTSGSSLSLSWTAATLSYTTGTISYSVYINNALYTTQTGRTLTIAESTLSGYANPMTIKVTASATSLSNTSQGATLTATSGSSTFTYVQSTTACTAPTAVSVSGTNVAPGASVTLSWSGAKAGTSNAISGYEIYRATSATGTYSKLTTVTSTATSGSTTVTAPTTSSSSYYYKVLTVGSVSGYSSEQSSVYATLTCSYSAPTAPTTVTIAGGSSAYAAPGASVTLAWSGASAGTNNAITGYLIYRDGVSYTSTTSTSISVPAHSTAGSSYTYTVYTKGTYSNSAVSTGRVVYTYGAPTAPTTLSVSNSTPDVGGSVTLSWSGAAAGSYNAITGYHIYRATSATGSYSYLTAVTTTATSGSCSVTAPSTMGGSYYYKVYTIGARSNSTVSDNYATVTAKTYTKCGAPTSLSLNVTTSTGANATLSWSGATAGTNNAISEYEIQRRESTDGTTYGDWTALSTTAGTTLSVVPPSSAGNYYQYRIRTQGSAGSSFYSDWKVSSNTLYRNYTTCGAPTSFSLNATLSRNSVTLSWSGATDGDGNGISDYEIQRCESADNSTWGAWSALTTTTSSSLSVAPPSTAGYYYKYRIRARGTAGASYYSAWTESSNTLRKDFSACIAPTSCQLSATMSSVNVTLSWSGANAGDGNAITGYEVQRCESSDGATYGSWTALSTTTSTSISVSPPSTSGHYYKYRVRTQGEAGSEYYSEWTESSNTLRAGHEELEDFTDPVLTAGQTPIKAIHMTELQDRVNLLLGWYGLEQAAFTTIVGNSSSGYTYLKDWTSHVLEIRNAIDRLGGSHDTWIAILNNCPSAAVIQQMRDIVMAF